MITWKITDTTSENGVITSAKYFVTAVDGDYIAKWEHPTLANPPVIQPPLPWATGA